MTPKEIVANIRRARSCVDDRNPGMALSLSAVDHLLAIHAAVLELFEAERVWVGRDLKDDIWDATFRLEIAQEKLATLCGYENLEERLKRQAPKEQP